MAYSITLLVNSYYPPKAEEGTEAPKNPLNEKGALIMDLVLASIALATGALALAAGAHDLGPLNFLGNLSQAWSISLISAGGGMILVDLSILAIKNCKKETSEAPLLPPRGPKEVGAGSEIQSAARPRSPSAPATLNSPDQTTMQLKQSATPPNNLDRDPLPTAPLSGDEIPLDEQGKQELLKLVASLPPPPSMEYVQDNIEDLHASLGLFVKKQLAAPQIATNPAIVQASLANIIQRNEVNEALNYVREYFEKKANAKVITPSGDLGASIIDAAATEIDSADLPEWLGSYLIALSNFMYAGETQESIKARLPAIYEALTKLEAQIMAANRIATGDPEANAMRKQAEAEAANKARTEAQFKKQTTICKKARWFKPFSDKKYDLTTMDLTKLKSNGKNVLVGLVDLGDVYRDVEKLRRRLEAVKPDQLLDEAKLQEIEAQGTKVTEIAKKIKKALEGLQQGLAQFEGLFA